MKQRPAGCIDRPAYPGMSARRLPEKTNGNMCATMSTATGPESARAVLPERIKASIREQHYTGGRLRSARLKPTASQLPRATARNCRNR
ncbi:MAG: hypothetical protein AMJ54_02035 [Deltaproteobacteria bacterium SG8_13]|nr:MAG: hypothetical protein AMJ54_02035 [Deltaproteobacteria bacterium SG8_13]